VTRALGVPSPGQVVEVSLPDGRYAYGRVLKDAGIAFYESISATRGSPPLGERSVRFTVSIDLDSLSSLPVVGEDPFEDEDDGWPPPMKSKDVLTNRWRIYHKGEFRSATEVECRDLETVGLWRLSRIVERLISGGPEASDSPPVAGLGPAASEVPGGRIRLFPDTVVQTDDWWLTLDCGGLPSDAAIVEAGHEPNAYFWEGVVAFSSPELAGEVELDSEAGTFRALGRRTDLVRLRALIEPLLQSPDAIRDVLERADAAGFVFDD